MYLKEIQVAGFKSFADKISIHLDDNITCIVGPNGSGKSNVVDAVRWVLGEQSVKSLRGDGAMTDVIFSGSKSRNALNVASVSLIFDNSDHYLKIPYTEVSVKRRVYRTGENEYFLNGEKCRLKDITDLFIDSGIGKESFNIISQGEVQKILSNSPYERRIIFEEAASVIKYKKRKEEAIRKLERTHSNLDRVADIIHELEIQLEPLEIQSKKAREYLENKKNLEQIEVALLAHEIETLNHHYLQAKKKMEDLNNEIVSLSVSHSGSDAAIDQEKTNLLHVEEELEQLNQELLVLTKKEEALNGEKKMLQERSKYKANDTKVHDTITHLKESKLKLGNEISILEQEIEFHNTELDQLNDSIRDIQVSLTQSQDKLAQTQRELHFQNKRKFELDNQISVLQNFIDNGGNIPTSVKAILNNPRLHGVHDCIGNLIRCDSKFAKALDVALGASKQFLVVDHENVAKEAIEYLKNGKLGRVTFFPLNIIQAKSVDPDTEILLKQEMGYVDTFAALVQYDSKYRNIVYNQLGNVLVVLDMDHANRISRKIHNRYRIVTLDGEIIHVGGSITGGNTSSSRSMITDQYELEKLIRTKDDVMRVIDEIDITISDDNKQIQEIEHRLYDEKMKLASLQETIRSKKVILGGYQDNIDQIDREYRSLEHVVDSSLSQEEERLMNEYYETCHQKDQTLLRIQQQTKEKEKLKTEIEEMEAKNRFNHSNLTKRQNDLKELEIQISKMDMKLDHYLNTLSEEYEITYEKAKEAYHLEIEVEEAREKVTIYKNNIKRIGMVNLASIEEYDSVHQRYTFLTSQRDDLLEAKDTLLEIIEEMDTVMKEEFLNTFKLIQKEFEVVFKQLFNGGRASLKLTDPNNLLETGVEIIASPPGKKLTTISLLSGGEKTLTAISLLFAILNIRPIPFCLFDEVEAALDEANVDNFGKYLDHYKSKTQFLLITHKKKTMEYANTLYGITMQESGVSKLVSVKLENQ
ncbi:MAG: AAA family ATPase [bacterium]|nr:AAA family ATPase [bacterium]